MKKRRQIIWGCCLAFALLVILGVVLLARPREPRLAIGYLSCTNFPGHKVASFKVTNKGSGAAIHYPHGEMEIAGPAQLLPVGTRSAQHQLPPGAQAVVEVVLPESFHGHCRFTVFYGHQGLKSRLYDWVWRPGGPGALANPFMPRNMKGVRLDVKATSDWFEL